MPAWTQGQHGGAQFLHLRQRKRDLIDADQNAGDAVVARRQVQRAHDVAQRIAGDQRGLARLGGGATSARSSSIT